MADSKDFDSFAYLRENYGDVQDQRAKFLLDYLHTTFQSLQIDGELKVLDFGSGPIIQNSISAAAFATEIVFCDISSANREAVRKWLDGEADAFNWSPHFDYVVKTLEGKSEKEAREREQRLRKISKVVCCDALSETPMEEGYEGPYDVILQCGCLKAACSDKSSFKSAMKALCNLLKPGGTLVDCSTEAAADSAGLKYGVGDQCHGYVSWTHEFVASILRDCGLTDVKAELVPLDQKSRFPNTVTGNMIGFHKVIGSRRFEPAVER